MWHAQRARDFMGETSVLPGFLLSPISDSVMLHGSQHLHEVILMKLNFLGRHIWAYRFASALLIFVLCTGPILAQRPAQSAGPAQQQPKPADPTFETLLATDAYKLYGEVRNVGQLLSTGGAGEIVEPIIKLAEPGKEFNSIINFLKKNAESLSSARLQFASWPARNDVPTVFVAIEFPTADDAAKFAPKLETFLPTVLPTAPSTEPEAKSSPTDPSTPPATSAAKAGNSSTQTVQGFPYLITRTGNLVFITEKSFKFEKLHPATSKPLFQDANFRTVHDKFSSEPVFVFVNVALEDKTKQQTQTQRPAKKEPAVVKEEPPVPQKEGRPVTTPTPEEEKPTEEKQNDVVLVAPAQSSPAPTPTKEEQAQAVAGRQAGQMLEMLGVGETQWPEAVGMAVALDGNEYVVRAMLIDKPDAKVLPIPFVPQLIAGPPYNAEASSVLPEDTEMFVSASINFAQTYEGMRKQAEIKAKNDTHSNYQVYEKGVLISSGSREREPGPDVFTQFETKAGFKIKDDLIPALGNEIALAGSITTLQKAGGFNFGAPPPPKPSPDPNDPKPKDEEVMPAFLIGVRDREAMKKLMPKVLVGLGIGEANLLAQVEKHGDSEIVNYAGMFAYGFVGDFIVISDTAAVRRVVDANENHQTLSSDTAYRNSRS